MPIAARLRRTTYATPIANTRLRQLVTSDSPEPDDDQLSYTSHSLRDPRRGQWRSEPVLDTQGFFILGGRVSVTAGPAARGRSSDRERLLSSPLRSKGEGRRGSPRSSDRERLLSLPMCAARGEGREGGRRLRDFGTRTRFSRAKVWIDGPFLRFPRPLLRRPRCRGPGVWWYAPPLRQSRHCRDDPGAEAGPGGGRPLSAAVLERSPRRRPAGSRWSRPRSSIAAGGGWPSSWAPRWRHSTVIFGKNTTEMVNKLSRRLHTFTEHDVVLLSDMEHHSNDLPWRKVPKVIRAAGGQARRARPRSGGVRAGSAIAAGCDCSRSAARPTSPVISHRFMSWPSWPTAMAR